MGETSIIRELSSGERLSFRWNGAHTVNVHRDPEDGRWAGHWPEVDVYSIGDFALDAASEEEFRESVEEMMAEYESGNR